MRSSRAVPLLVLLAVAALGACTSGGQQSGRGADKVTICHATSSDSNPFVQISVDKDGAVSGHDGHPNDIIPPFDYLDNDGKNQHYAGKNWGSVGQALHDNRCNAVSPEPVTPTTPAPTAAPTTRPTIPTTPPAPPITQTPIPTTAAPTTPATTGAPITQAPAPTTAAPTTPATTSAPTTQAPPLPTASPTSAAPTTSPPNTQAPTPTTGGGTPPATGGSAGPPTTSPSGSPGTTNASSGNQTNQGPSDPSATTAPGSGGTTTPGATTTVAGATTTAADPADAMPRTGGDTNGPFLVGAVLVGLGLLAVLLGRRVVAQPQPSAVAPGQPLPGPARPRVSRSPWPPPSGPPAAPPWPGKD